MKKQTTHKRGAKPGNQNAKKESPRVYLPAMVSQETADAIKSLKARTKLSNGKILDEAVKWYAVISEDDPINDQTQATSPNPDPK